MEHVAVLLRCYQEATSEVLSIQAADPLDT
jgi:hypothetical protein